MKGGMIMAKRKRILKLFLLFFLVTQIFVPSKKVIGATNTEKNIPLDAIAYANEHYKEVINLEEYYKEKNKGVNIRFDDLKLGSPFVIYEIGESVQDEIYYFPLIDSNDSIILVMNVIGTTKGWCVSFSDEWVDELQKLDVLALDDNIFKSGDVLYVGNNISVNSSCANISNSQLKNILLFSTDKRFVKVDTEHISISDENIKDKYTPSINAVSNDSKQCVLYNKKGQGNYGLCWAASVATICNYLNGSNKTAKNVADKMHIGYNEGAGLYIAQQAMMAYGVIYNKFNNNAAYRMSWSELKTNINGKYPVYVSAKSSKDGHAVVAYGFTVAAGTPYVALWNPGVNGGKGDSISAAFSESRTAFAYANKTYVWKYSVSKY